MTVKIYVNADTEHFSADVVFPEGVPRGGYLKLIVGDHNENRRPKYEMEMTSVTAEKSTEVPVVRKVLSDFNSKDYHHHGKIFMKHDLLDSDYNNYTCFVRSSTENQENLEREYEEEGSSGEDTGSVGKQKYKCCRCSFATHSRDVISRHEDFHEGFGFHCAVCKEKFMYRQEHWEHLSHHFRDQKFTCCSCSLVFNVFDDYLEHFQKCGKLIECPECHQGFESKRTFSKHKRLCEQKPEPLVDAPPRKRGRPPGSKKVKLQTPPKQTDLVEKANSNSEPEKKSSQVKENTDPYNEDTSSGEADDFGADGPASDHEDNEGRRTLEPLVEIVEQESSRRPETRPHRRFITTVLKLSLNRNKVKCPYCSTPFNSEKKLEWHKRRKHQDEAPFECEICQKKYFAEDQYNKHSEVCGKKRSTREKRGRVREGRERVEKAPKQEASKRPKRVIPPVQVQCESCSSRFYEYDDLTSHIRSEHADKELFSCSECGKLFAHQVFLMSHEVVHEKEKNAKGDWSQCKLCNKSFKTLKEIQTHFMSHTTSRLYKCNLCEASYNYKWNLIAHMRNHEPDQTYPCSQCNKVFPTPRGCRRHVINCHIRRDFTKQCNLCSKKYPTNYLLQVHLAMAHFNELSQEEIDSLKVKLLQCEDCNFKTYCRKSFNRHRAIHKGENPFQCHICNKKFAFRWILNQHIRTNHKSEGGKCPHCPRFFMANETFSRHISMHYKNEGFTCDKCNKMYETKSLLESHAMQHNSSTSYVCQICNTKFTSNRWLARHCHIAHNAQAVCRPFPRKPDEVWKYQCEVCSVQFKFKSSLTAHQMFVHNRDDPNPSPTCNICHRSFRNLIVLSAHVRTHTGEKPYKCPHCSKGFGQYLHMRNHIIYLHTKKFRIFCPLCKKGFIDNTKMRRHLKLGHKAVLFQNKSSASPVIKRPAVSRRRKESQMVPPLPPPPPLPPHVTTSAYIPPHRDIIPVSTVTSTSVSVTMNPQQPHFLQPSHHPHHQPTPVVETVNAVDSLINAMTCELVPYNEELVPYSEQCRSFVQM